MDFPGFFKAFSTDLLSLISGIASIILTIASFLRKPEFLRKLFKKPDNQRKLFWFLALLCFLISSVRVWTEEHNKRMSDYAYLQAGTRGYYDGNPFLLNSPISVLFLWQNTGNSPAKNPRPFAKIYLRPDGDMATQESTLREFNEDYKKDLKISKKEFRWIFPSPNIATSLSVNGDILTDSLTKELIANRKTLFAISAVRFTDSRGTHEAHSCQFINSLMYVKNVKNNSIVGISKVEWSDCKDYTTQIDIKDN